MTAYLIAQLNFTDQSYMKEYREGVVPLIKKHGGNQLVGGAPVAKLEGDDWELPDRVIVIEFPTLEQARAWYDDPDYAPLIKLRRSGAISKLMLAESIG